VVQAAYAKDGPADSTAARSWRGARARGGGTRGREQRIRTLAAPECYVDEAMRRVQRGGVTAFGAVLLGCLGLLADCGGTSGSSPFEEGGPGDQDGTLREDNEAPESGGEAAAADGTVSSPDAGDDGAADDATTALDADAGSIDAGADTGALDAGADTGALDAGADTGALDAGADASSLDAGADAGSLDAGADAADAAPGFPCDAQASCTGPSTVTCCGGQCVDTARDPANCGQCGAACTTNQFCTGTACENAIVANVCANASGTVVLDGLSVDDEAGISMGAALGANCVPATTIVQAGQFTPGILDPSDAGRPILGAGNTFIAGGGPYGQHGIAYMEAAITPVWIHNDGATGSILTRAGTAVVAAPEATLTAHHDYFYVQVSVEPQSSTLCFSGVGILAPGTQAAGYYVAAQILPNRTTYTKSWYAYEWTDTNNDSVANAGDSFQEVMEGP
jgi:hypothetical protein